MATGVLDTPFGPLHIVTTGAGVARIDFGRCARQPVEHTDAVVGRDHLEQARAELTEYLAGSRRSFSVALDRSDRRGFRGEVLDALESVPFGDTVSYAELAARAGRPNAFRAVGTTMGLNPIAVIVPCHRVLRSGGELGQYGGGVETKRWLLTLEGWPPPG